MEISMDKLFVGIDIAKFDKREEIATEDMQELDDEII